MFEFSVIRKYLIPKKRHLSVSLIGMMSFFVIASVVWLILIFLSVTSGIEQNWLSKLTQLNAPLQVNPTQRYYQSYYYLVDQYAADSFYQTKTLREKRNASKTDPYDPYSDSALPKTFPASDSKDLVKELFECIQTLQEKNPSIGAQDYEVAPTLLKIKLFRPSRFSQNLSLSQNVITQACYLQSIMDSNPSFAQVLLPPSEQDLDQLLSKLRYSISSAIVDQPSYEVKRELTRQGADQLRSLFEHGHIEQIALYPEKPLFAAAFKQTTILHGEWQSGALFIKEDPSLPSWEISENRLYCATSQKEYPLAAPLYFEEGSLFTVEGYTATYDWIVHLPHGKGKLEINPFNASIVKAKPAIDFSEKPSTSPLWAYRIKGLLQLPTSTSSDGILAPRYLRDQDVRIGDLGYVSTGTFSFSSQQEQRIPIQVAGFYDPGIMSVGARAVFAPYQLVHTTTIPGYEEGTDPILKNGIQVWGKNLEERHFLKKNLERLIEEKGLSSYFTVSTLEDYPFARDLLEQFQSDKTLFMLIGFIILCVACSNIIALLMILVKDKKKEIGIMQAMGASKKSIALIFGGVGAFVGLMSCLMGIVFAYLTLQNIDTIVSWLSYAQGRAAFNPIFYGQHLPSTLSHEGLIFLLICTPLLSLIASLVPASMAMRLSTTAILRSEG